MRRISTVSVLLVFIIQSFYFRNCDSFKVSGQLFDSFDRTPVSGGQVQLVASSTYESTSDSDGYYTITDVPAGTYQVYVTSDGRWRGDPTLVVDGDELNYDFALSERPTGTNFELLVYWGRLPANLDAYLFTPYGCNTSRLNPNDCKSGSSSSQILVNDVNGWGPESIKLRNAIPGTYEFYVKLESSNPNDVFVQPDNGKDPVAFFSSPLNSPRLARQSIVVDNDPSKKWWRAISLVVNLDDSFTYSFPNQLYQTPVLPPQISSATSVSTTASSSATSTATSATSTATSATSTATSATATTAAATTTSGSSTTGATATSAAVTTTPASSTTGAALTSAGVTVTSSSLTVSTESSSSTTEIVVVTNGATGGDANGATRDGGSGGTSGKTIGIIIGAIIGGALLLLIIAVLIFLLIKKNRRNHSNEPQFHSDDSVVKPNIAEQQGKPSKYLNPNNGYNYNQGRQNINLPPIPSNSNPLIPIPNSNSNLKPNNYNYNNLSEISGPPKSSIPPEYNSMEYPPSYHP